MRMSLLEETSWTIVTNCLANDLTVWVKTVCYSCNLRVVVVDKDFENRFQVRVWRLESAECLYLCELTGWRNLVTLCHHTIVIGY